MLLAPFCVCVCVFCFSPVAEDDVAARWDLPWVSSQLICRRIHQATPSAPGST